MKYVKPLTEAERVTLQEAWKYGPTVRVRQRGHALYLSAQGFRIPRLVEIFEVDRDTLSGWIDDWEQYGILGLYDAPRCGRPPIYSAPECQRLQELVAGERLLVIAAEIGCSEHEVSSSGDILQITRVKSTRREKALDGFEITTAEQKTQAIGWRWQAAGNLLDLH